jgi:rubredoxin
MAREPDETTAERELTRRLRQRNVSMRCPACDWTLDGPIGDYVLLPAGAATDGAAARGGVKLKVFACRNCGYVRVHSANLLSDISRRA